MSLTHHAVLPQNFNEVEGVEAQEQNKLVLTFTVVTRGLGGGETRKDPLNPRPMGQEPPLRAEPSSVELNRSYMQNQAPDSG